MRSTESDRKPRPDLIVFDGDCIFCSGFARFIARHDRKARFRFVTAQSATGRRLFQEHGLDPHRMETNLVIADGAAHVRMAAFAAAVRALGAPWSALAVVNVLPRPVGDWLYARIALNRYAFGKRRCPMPSSELRGRLVE